MTTVLRAVGRFGDMVICELGNGEDGESPTVVEEAEEDIYQWVSREILQGVSIVVLMHTPFRVRTP